MPQITNRTQIDCRIEAPACPVCGGLECLCRPRFYPGQLLTEEDLNRLDRYIVEKNKLHNRYVHGWGVVCGLQVVCHECEGWVTVKAGYAIDPCGNDIIVCRDHDFDLIEHIRQCCQKRRRDDCEPWRRRSDQSCQDVEQEWCLVLSYQEREARSQPTLRPKMAQSCGCCRGNGQRCGCGCHRRGNGHAKPDYTATPTPSRRKSAALHCEPTLICEDYCLEVIPAKETQSRPQDIPSSRLPTLEPGTLAFEAYCCRQTVIQLMQQAPTIGTLNPNEAYSSCCSFRERVRDFLYNSSLTRCELLDQLNQITCPPPPPNPDTVYISQVEDTIKQIAALLGMYMGDCICLSLLPPCPPDPGEDRLILACVTVRNDKIVRICHFPERRQLLSFPALAYWFSLLPVGDVFSALFGKVCCGDIRQPQLTTTPRTAQPAFSINEPMQLYQSLATLLNQNLGAEALMALRPEQAAEILDVRSLRGGTIEQVTAQLDELGVPDVIVEPVDTLPNEAVALGERYWPTTFSTKEPLIVYTRGQTVIGFNAPTEAQRLRLELEALKDEVAELRGTQPPAGYPSTPVE